MKKELLKEVKKLLDNKELSREELLIELFKDDEGDLVLIGLDFTNLDGDVIINNMKVKGNLQQGDHRVGGNLFQDHQEVKGYLYENNSTMEGK